MLETSKKYSKRGTTAFMAPEQFPGALKFTKQIKSNLWNGYMAVGHDFVLPDESVANQGTNGAEAISR